MSVPVLSRSLVACRTALAGTADAFHGLRRRRSDVAPRPPVGGTGLGQSGKAAAASHDSPTDPTLRANPFPEVTDLFCRLPLPTLFYRPEAVHLGDLLRLSVRPDTTMTRLPRIFTGRRERTGQRKKCAALPDMRTLSPADLIPGWQSVKKKRQLFPGPSQPSPSSFASPHRPLPRGERADPCSGSGILTRFPFDRRRGPKTCALPNGTSLSLRID